MADEGVELERLVVKLMADASQYDQIIQKAVRDVAVGGEAIKAAANSAMAAQSRAMEEAARITAAVATPYERYSAITTNLATHLTQGRISQETFNKSLQQAYNVLPPVAQAQEDVNRMTALGARITAEVATKEEIYAQKAHEVGVVLGHGKITQETYNRAIEKLRATLPSTIAQQEAMKASTQRMLGEIRRASEIMASTETRAEAYRRKLAEINTYNQQGALTTESYRRAVANLNKEYATLQPTLQKSQQTMMQIGSTLSMRVTAPVVGLGIASAKGFADFQSGLLNIESVTRSTPEQLDNIRESALSLSKELSVKPVGITQSFGELLKAGASIETVLGGAGKAAVQFAKVGELEMGQAAVVTTDAMNVFHRSAEETVDTLSAAADASSVSIRQIVDSFSQASAVAGQTGISLRDTAAAIAILGQQGIKGSDAGTSLRTMLLRLKAPTDTATEIMDQYRISVRDTSGEMKSMPDLIEELRVKLGGLDSASRDSALLKLFGQDAIRSATVFMATGREGFERMTRAMDESRSVSEKYDIQMKGLHGTWQGFTAAVDRMRIAIGEAMSKSLGNFLGVLQSVVEFIGKWVEDNQELATVLAVVAGIAATIGPLLLIGGAVAGSINAVVIAYTSLSAALTATTTASVLAKAGWIGLGIVAASLARTLIKELIPAFQDYNRELERKNQLEGQVLDMDKRQQAGIIEQANAITNLADRRKFLNDQIAKAKNVGDGMLFQDKMMVQEGEKLNTVWNNMVDMVWGHAGMGDVKNDREKLKERFSTHQSFMRDMIDLRKRTDKEISSAPDPVTTPTGQVVDAGKFQKAQEQAKELLEKHRTPMEKYMVRVQELTRLHHLLGESFDRAYLQEMQEARDALVKSDPGHVKEAKEAEKVEKAAKKAHEEAKKRADDVQRLLDKHASPMEKYKKTERELIELRDEHGLSLEAFNAEMKEARDKMQGEVKIKFKVEGLDALESGTNEALAAFEAFKALAKAPIVVPARRPVGGDGADLKLSHLENADAAFGADIKRTKPQSPDALKNDDRQERMLKILEAIALHTDPKNKDHKFVVLQPSELS